MNPSDVLNVKTASEDRIKSLCDDLKKNNTAGDDESVKLLGMNMPFLLILNEYTSSLKNFPGLNIDEQGKCECEYVTKATDNKINGTGETEENIKGQIIRMSAEKILKQMQVNLKEQEAKDAAVDFIKEGQKEQIIIEKENLLEQGNKPADQKEQVFKLPAAEKISKEYDMDFIEEDKKIFKTRIRSIDTKNIQNKKESVNNVSHNEEIIKVKKSENIINNKGLSEVFEIKNNVTGAESLSFDNGSKNHKENMDTSFDIIQNSVIVPKENTESFNVVNDIKESIINQVTERFDEITSNKKNIINIKLKPDYLGNIKIKVELENDCIKAKITTDTPEVKDILAGRIEQLKTNLKNIGIQVNNIEIHEEKNYDFNNYRNFNFINDNGVMYKKEQNNHNNMLYKNRKHKKNKTDDNKEKQNIKGINNINIYA